MWDSMSSAMCLGPEAISSIVFGSKMNELASAAKQIELSIVMPCLNERETVGVCVRKALTSLREAGINGEVIVSDNGSTDGSVEIAESEGARVIHVADRAKGRIPKAVKLPRRIVLFILGRKGLPG
jgi:glycosyltransferase involved in cell wall biosynthesis